MKKIYVGCSLTQAPPEFCESIERWKDDLRKKYEVLDFVGLVNGTNQDVFRHDTECVRTCDLFVANCTYPGIGLGYELGVALESDKRVLAIAEDGAKVTRLVLGIDRPNFTLVRYKNLRDVEPLIDEMLA